ncbi:MAG: P-II family nitrogen regulator [Dethiobacter sp.]|jgi:nitrogen regulatory protein PII|nr:P-II family nitrogen regulator [Dethiobacter sp.]
MSENLLPNYKLIVSIVNKGKAKAIVSASKQAGAEGGTVILGRGTGTNESKTFFGICIDPEKEVILTLIENCMADIVLSSIVEAGKLENPGCGIAFVLNTKQIAGIFHLLKSCYRGAHDGKE